MTFSLPVPLTAGQISTMGANLVTVINNASTYQTNKTTDVGALQTLLTAAQAQIQTDIGAAPQVLAQDVLTANGIQKKITNVSATYDASILKANSNATILARDLAVGYSMQPVACTVDTQGIVTRNDTGTIVSWMKIVPPPKS